MSRINPIKALCGQCAGSNGSIDQRAVRLDPLLHVLLHAQSDHYELEFPRRSRYDVMLAAEQVRGEPFWWLNRQRGAADPELVSWMRKTPSVLQWVESPRAFRAPLWWPEDVEKSFMMGDPPSPYELANALPSPEVTSSFWYGHDVAILMGYACGLGLVDLHEIIGVSEGSLVNCMVKGVTKLRKHSPFVLWCLNLNFDMLPVSVGLGRSLQEKLRIHGVASKNPLRGTAGMFDDVVRSPVFKTSASKGLLPKRMGGRPVNRYVMIGEPRG